MKKRKPHLFFAAVALVTALLGFTAASAQTPPTPTHTFNATTNSTFGTNTNWIDSTLPLAGSHVLIADGKTATMSQTDANTLFGSLTLGVNSTINLAASLKQGPIGGSVIYFNNGSHLNYTSGDTNRAATYNIVSGATARMTFSATTSGDSLPQGSLVGDSTTTVNYDVVNLTNARWNASAFNGTLNFNTNLANNARAVNFSNNLNFLGSGITNIGTFVRVTASKSNLMNDSGTLQLTGSSGGASNVKFDMGANTDTIGNFVIASPTGATASAPTYRGSNTLTVSGTTTFQGTAGDVNFDSSNGTPSSHNLITTSNMTFGGTGTWAVAGDGRINLNAASGTRTITTNANASISNILVGTQGFTKAGASTLTLNGSAANVFTGGIALNSGSLTLDYANMATATNLVVNTNALTLGGGNLLLRGKTGGANATSQTLGNVSVNAGGGSTLINPNGGLSTSLILGTLTATSQGSSLTLGTALGAGAGTATITTTSNKNAQDIYGGRVVFANGTANTGYDWTTTVSAGPAYTLSAYSGYTAMATSGTDTANSRISATSTLAGSLTTNSLKIEDPAASQLLDLDGNLLELTSGGLLLTGTNALQINGTSGNSLTAGNGSGAYDLVVHQYNSGGLDIAAVIANNGANATSLTKAGSSSLTLSGSNTFTGGLFISDGTVTIANGGALNSTSGSENAVTIAGSGALSLNGNSLVVSNLSSANTTTDGGIVQNANATAATLTVGNSANLSGTFAGVIQNGSGGGAIALLKTGTGKLTLTNANTFTGATNVDVGVLNIQNAAALGATAGSTTVASGAALEIQGGITVGAEALTLNGTGISSGGALRNVSGNNTYGGLLSLAGAASINSDAGLLLLSNTGTITGNTFGLTVGGAGNTTIHSIIGTTSGTLTKENGGTLTLTGTNTYTGGTNVNGGVLALGSSGALGTSGTISFGGGTLQFGPSNTVDYSARFSSAASQAVNINTNGQNVTFASDFTSTGGTLTKTGNGILTLGGANSHTGTTALNAGILRLTNTGAVQNTSRLNMATGTTLELRKDTSGGVFTNTRLSPVGTVTIDANRITAGSGQTLTLGGTVVYANSPTAQLNFTGGNTYDVGLNAMYFNASTTNQTFTLNPTTANVKIGAIRGNPSSSNVDGWGSGSANNFTLVLGGTATNNTIASITDVGNVGQELIITKNTSASWTVTGNIVTNSGRGHSVSAGTLNLGGTWTLGTTGNTGRNLTVSGTGILGYNNAAAIQTLNTDNWLIMSGGSLDNSSGAAITTSTYNPRMQWNGNFTFLGSNGADSDLNLGTGAVNFGAVTAGGARTVTVNAAKLTVGGVISNGTNATPTTGLTKAGAGTLSLTGANTFSGTLTVSNGTLSIATINNASSNGTLGNSASAVLLGSSGTTGTLEYTGATASTTRPFSAAAGGTAAFNVTNSDATLTYSAELGGSGNITLGGAGNHIVAGGIGGTVGTFTKEGAGAVTLNGNGHGAAFVINQGKVNVNSASAFGSSTSLSLANGVTLDNTSGSAVTVNNANLAKTLGSSLNFTGTQDLSLGTGSTLLTANTTFDVTTKTLTLAGNVTGSFGIIKNGLGTLVLSGLTTGSFVGNSEVNAGELFLDGTSVLAGTSANTITLNTGGTLRIGATGSTGAVTVVNNGGTLISTTVQNSNQTFAANTTLSSSNAKFNGVQTISADTTVTSASDLFGTIPADPTAGRIVMQNNAVMRSTSEININANKGIALTGDNAIFNAATGSIFINSQVTGTGRVIKEGSGGFRMLNTSNTYEGGTEIRGGTFGIYGDGSLGAAGTSVRIDGATLNSGQGTSGQTITIGSTRSIEIAKGKTNHLDATNGSTLVFDGVISEFGDSGSANLQINTAGSREGMVILGGANTYTGNTTVSGGMLAITGTGSINSSSGISVASGAHFKYNSSTALTAPLTLSSGSTLSGSGTIGVDLALTSTSQILAPGNSPGIQTLATTQNWSSFTYEWETNDFLATTAGTDFDQIAITGDLNLTGMTEGSYILDIISLTSGNLAGAVPNFTETNRSWEILTATGEITGFNAAYWTLNTDGFTSDPAWQGTWSLGLNGSNDALVLNYTVIPEPKAALLGGLGILLLFRRRRR
jgi:fibronectin-binding autotransporter adhesin